MMVFKDGWFRCLGCDRNGTWKILWNKYKGRPLQPKSEKTTQFSYPNIRPGSEEDVIVQAHLDLTRFPSLGWYLEMRGMEDAIIPQELGYWNGWYTVPVRDDEDKFLTGVFRAGPHVQEATGLRYWNPAGKPVMYVPNWVKWKTSEVVFVVFGIFDAIALSRLGYGVATTTAGQREFKPEWLDDVRKPIWIIPDEREESSALRLAGNLGWRGRVLRLRYPDGIKDPAGFFSSGKKKELEVQLCQTL
jgi:hypothetical protein